MTTEFQCLTVQALLNRLPDFKNDWPACSKLTWFYAYGLILNLASQWIGAVHAPPLTPQTDGSVSARGGDDE
jgi:hypothetical protein